MKDAVRDLIRGLWKENPVLVLLLGTCPTLATTSSAANGFAMGIATMCVLCGSNLVISCIAGIVPKKIRIFLQVSGMAATNLSMEKGR